MHPDTLVNLLERAVQHREQYFDEQHESAFRLFNGFLEGCPSLVADLYGRTIVLYNHSEEPAGAVQLVETGQQFLLRRLPFVHSVIVKTRSAGDEQARRGLLVYGDALSRKILENGVWYAVDLTLNSDASLYLDTRGLRAWAKARMAGRRVLNTFAYTGSLGVAAAAGGAALVIHTDRNRKFLNLAKDSYTLNKIPIRRADFLAGDFWVQVNSLKRAGMLFDCVFVDPPFFSATSRGTVDLVAESHRVINKVRPLVSHQGWLVTINNALFLSGEDYMAMLRALCADGYLSIEELIPIPPDFTGFPGTQLNQPPVDPAPFNHSTKIVVLRVTRKDQK